MQSDQETEKIVQSEANKESIKKWRPAKFRRKNI